MMWADMLLDPRCFRDACFSQAGCSGGPPDHLDRALDRLPRDIVMCDWHFEPAREFPTIRYLQDVGFDTLGCSGFPVNTALFTRYALAHRTRHFLGMMVTAWHTIDRGNQATLTRIIRQNGRTLARTASCWQRDPRVKRIAAVCAAATKPVPPGRPRMIYRFTIDGAGALHSRGWIDFGYREYPLASPQFKGPAHGIAIEGRAGGLDHLRVASRARTLFPPRRIAGRHWSANVAGRGPVVAVRAPAHAARARSPPIPRAVPGRQ